MNTENSHDQTMPVSTQTGLSSAFKIIYFALFSYFLYVGVQRLFESKISTSIRVDKKGFKWPSTIAICGLKNKGSVDLKNKLSFADFETKVHGPKNSFNVTMEFNFFFTEEEPERIILAEESIEDQVHMHPGYPNPFLKCAMIRIPEKYIENPSMTLCFNFKKLDQFDQMLWEFSSDGQSKVKFGVLDYENVFITDTCDECYGGYYFLKMEDNIRLSTDDYRCSSDLIDHWQCIQKFLSAKMNCSTPWEAEYSKPGQKLCETKEEMNDYFELRRHLNRGTFSEELKEMGCFKINCRQISWSTKQLASMTKAHLQKIATYEGVEDNIQQHICLEPMLQVCFIRCIKNSRDISCTIVLQADIIEEYYVYGFVNFLAEVGGYLGLFLGASFLSLTTFLIEFLCFRRRLCNSH